MAGPTRRVSLTGGRARSGGSRPLEGLEGGLDLWGERIRRRELQELLEGRDRGRGVVRGLRRLPELDLRRGVPRIERGELLVARLVARRGARVLRERGVLLPP